MEYKLYNSLEEMKDTPFFPLRMATSISFLINTNWIFCDKYSVEIVAPNHMKKASFKSIDQTVNFLGDLFNNYLIYHANIKRHISYPGNSAEDNSIVLNCFGQDKLHFFFEDKSEKTRPFLQSECFIFEEQLKAYKIIPNKNRFTYSIDDDPHSIRAGYKFAENVVKMIKNNNIRPYVIEKATEFITGAKLISTKSAKPEQLGIYLYTLKNPGSYELVGDFLKKNE